MRKQREVSEDVLGRAGRYQKVSDNLEVEDVVVSGRRQVVFRNPQEAEKDRPAREAILAKLEQALAHGPECPCVSASVKPGKCGCGKPLGWGPVLEVEGSDAYVCTCKEGCTCKLDSKDATKCGCREKLKKVGLEGRTSVCAPAVRCDGRADTEEPGETLVLEIDADNRGTLDASSVSGALASSEPLVTVTGPAALWPSIPRGDFRRSLAPHFTFDLAADWVCGDPVPFSLDFAAAEGPGAWNSTFQIPTGRANVTTTFADAMENGINGWTVQTLEGSLAWNQTTGDASSPTRSWFVQDIGTRAETVLLMPQIASLPANSELRFRHRFNTEANYDGGVLEYSANGGPWSDAGALLTAGGYNGSIRSSASTNLAGRNAWAGDSGAWVEAKADLSSLAGAAVRFRWRFATDTSVTDEGWYVDDVVVDTTAYTCEAALAKPGEASGLGGSPFRSSKDVAGFALTWSAPTTGGSAASYRLYRTVLGGAPSPECEADLGSGTSAVLPGLTDDRGSLVVARNAAGEGTYGSDGAGAPRAPAAVPCPGVSRSARSGPIRPSTRR